MIRLCAFADEYGSTLEEQIEGLKSNEIDLIELRGIDGRSFMDLTIEEAERYSRRFTAEGISVWALGSPLGKVDISVDMDAYMDRVRHCCELAKVFHTDKIRMFSFFNAYEQKEAVMQTLRRMVEIADAYGVKLYHENEKDIYGDTLTHVLEICEEVEGLHFVYDPANYLQVGEPAEGTLAGMLHKTDYFHVKDVIAETEEIVPAGYGDGHIGEILNTIDGDYTFTLEPHLTVFSGYASIDKTEMKHKFVFENSREAFCFAAQAFKTLLQKCGYQKTKYNQYERC